MLFMSPVAHPLPHSQNAAMSLLDDFSDGDVLFATHGMQWRAHARDGVLSAYCPVTPAAVQALFDRAQQQGVQAPVLFGLVPFDARRPASLSIPCRVQASRLDAPPLDALTVSSPATLRCVPVPPPEQYGDMVRRALQIFATQDLRKIVLARAMDITLDAPLDYGHLLMNLWTRNRQGYTFALPMWSEASRDAPTGVLVGASPELLVRREGDVIHVNPLAGSIGRDPDPEKDAYLRDSLAASAKDLREHAYVVDDIHRILRTYCTDLHVPTQPSLISTDTLWHLSTAIHGRLRQPSMTALALACALHPTPAICGTPTVAAAHHLSVLEPFDREYYAGLVGWQLPDGDGEWVLALRCARYSGGRHLRLYAGAGIVAGSNPDQEIVETTTKLQTFLRALR